MTNKSTFAANCAAIFFAAFFTVLPMSEARADGHHYVWCHHTKFGSDYNYYTGVFPGHLGRWSQYAPAFVNSLNGSYGNETFSVNWVLCSSAKTKREAEAQQREAIRRSSSIRQHVPTGWMPH